MLHTGTGAELRPCPICGSLPTLRRELLPLAGWGLEFEPPHPAYRYACDCCGFSAPAIRCIYNPITDTTITEEDAPARALNAWNRRDGNDKPGEQLRACPICGTTDAQRTAAGRISMARIRAKTTRPGNGLELYRISCTQCGCGIGAEYAEDSPPEEVERIKAEIRQRWNRRSTKKA